MSARKAILLACTAALASLALLAPAGAQAAFGIRSFSVTASNPDATVDTQAGSHPDLAVSMGFNLQAGGEEAPEGKLSALYVHLPPGLIGEIQNMPVCSRAVFASAGQCPTDTVVGIAFVDAVIAPEPAELAIYNLGPPLGSPATLGGTIFELNSFQEASLRSETDFGVDISDATLPAGAEIRGIEEVIWGRPYETRHDEERGETAINGRKVHLPAPAPFTGPHLPFLTLPTSCHTSLTTTLEVESLEEPGVRVSESVGSLDGTPGPSQLTGCANLAFEPTISAQPTNPRADSPTGLDVAIHQPQDEDPEGTATAALQAAQVTLPEGITLNPSAANGLGACTEAQIGRLPTPGIHFNKTPQSCPNAAKVGLAEVSTPLLDHPLQGAVYVAAPYANPFGSLLAIYLVIEDELSGTYAKLAGRVTPNPLTGQLSASFTENPQLPLEDINLSFFGGDRAALKTPLACGTYTTQTVLTPWSAPEAPSATPSSSFATNVAAAGSGPCPASEAAAPNSPGFEAGTVTPIAGSYSPFLLRLTRPDGSQHIAGIDVTLPGGLLGKLAGIPYCSEAQIALARSREAPNQGASELASPACPAASEVGGVTVGAGAGPTPLYVSGRAYLAGPYKGAPLSLAIITPAIAGPFDLGDVVVRVALRVDPTTAQIEAVSDPLPTIIAGIPLDLRSLAVRLDRPGFTLNPTSCEAKSIGGQMTSQTGQAAPLQNRFQVGGCGALKFKPKLALKLTGSTQRGKNPALRAVLTQPKGQANIGRVSVVLPKSEFIDNRHINNPCTRVQFNAGAGNGAQCPAGSILGKATAYTPLLAQPLKGPVYFRSNGGERQLPDLVASLGGQVHLNLVGFIDSVHKKGSEVSRTRNTFALVPDAPVSKFVLELKGGKQGLLQNSANLCKVSNVAQVKLGAQNGKDHDFATTIANDCKGKKGTKGGKGSKGR